MSRDFSDYLDKLYRSNQSQRARMRLLRLDDYEQDEKRGGPRSRGNRAELQELAERRWRTDHDYDAPHSRGPARVPRGSKQPVDDDLEYEATRSRATKKTDDYGESDSDHHGKEVHSRLRRRLTDREEQDPYENYTGGTREINT